MHDRSQPLSQRVISRLVEAEAREQNAWLRDDLQIARLTVLHAARGDAVLCSPDVLASFEVLGLHPNRVWPAIQARRSALGFPEEFAGGELPPKKPPVSAVVRSQQTLWFEKTNAARTVNSRGAIPSSGEPAISVPMAAPSIAALYRNSDGPSSAKVRQLTYGQLLDLVKFSGAPRSIRSATVNALSARGEWPNADGPAHGILCVSLKGMMLGNDDGMGNVVRSTARWRARRAVKLGFWRLLRQPNSWSNCPKCGTERRKHSVDCMCGDCPMRAGRCKKCGYEGRAKTPAGKANFDEFCRPYMYEIDIEKFRTAPRPKGLLEFEERTYDAHKAAEKRAEAAKESAEVKEWPRKPSRPAPPDDTPPPTKVEPRQPAAEHAHRGNRRGIGSMEHERKRALSASVVTEMTVLMKGGKSQGDALREVCLTSGLTANEVQEILKLCLFKAPEPAPRAASPPNFCSTCGGQGRVLNLNNKPGEKRLIPCPKCAEET